MKVVNYKRGRYNKSNPKEKKITFLSDDKMVSELNQIAALKQVSKSKVLRSAFKEYYCKALKE